MIRHFRRGAIQCLSITNNGKPYAKFYFYNYSQLLFLVLGFETHSLKKRLLKFILLIVTLSRTAYLFYSEDMYLEHFFDVERSILEDPTNNFCFFYMSYSITNERRRCYVNIYYSDRTPKSFYKVGYENDFMLQKEFRFQSQINGNRKDSFRTISTKSEKKVNDLIVYEYECIGNKYKNPKSRWTSDHENFIRDIIDNTEKISAINDLSWLMNIYERLESSWPKTFSIFLSIMSERKFIRTHAAHGDLHCGNIFNYKDDYIIIDWESYSENAPKFTDKTINYMAENYTNVRVAPFQVINYLISTFNGPRDEKILYFLSIMFFGVSNNRIDSMKLLDCFELNSQRFLGGAN